MAHRIRVAAALAATIAISSFASPPASAGPSKTQPAQVHLTLGEARYYARVATGYLGDGLANPEKPRVGRCNEVGKVWRCQTSTEGSDTRCTITVWIWGDRLADRWYEYHDLRCEDR